MAVVSTNVYSIISTFFHEQTEPYTDIPKIKHIDDGIHILKVIGKFPKHVYDAWCLYPIYDQLTQEQRTALFASLSIIESHIDRKTLELIGQFIEVKNSFTLQHVVDNRIDRFNLYILCPKLKALLITMFIQQYTDFSRAIGENKYDTLQTHSIDDMADYYNLWLQRLGIIDSNIDPLVLAVSRLYPWSQPK